MTTLIETFGKYTNVRQAATSSTTHGMTNQQVEDMHARMNSFMPRLHKFDKSHTVKSMFEKDLPAGASWSKSAQAYPANLGQGGNLHTVQTPYQPEFADPSRQQYPVHRILANRYWRMFYKLDPTISTGIDLYGDLPWSNFELTGEGIEGEIRQAYEYMCRETQLLAMLPAMVREFLIVGETIPHVHFDDSKGVFVHIALHNPDQLEVIDAPFIKMEPFLEFVPDDRLLAIVNSNEPGLAEIRQSMPPELVTRLQSRQRIPLSPLNATFIPRKMHPYDTRGTSIISRMWRILMYEDAVFNASIQMARRHAAPVKVVKLGNASTGWIPPPEQEQKMLQLLAQAEMDPNSWIVTHYGVAFEAWGSNDRAISISRELDTIERLKLISLGISKSFLTGESSFATAATGLQVFMQRLKSLRLMFEQKWLYSKFFRPIAEINGWIKSKPSEVQHRFRVKRSAAELNGMKAYIVPKIVWDKSLDPQVNNELINAMQALEGIGVKFSKTSKMASVGYSFEEETKKINRELKFEKQFNPKVTSPQGAEAGMGGMGGGGGMPPMGGAPMGEELPGPEEGGQTPPGLGGEPPPGIEEPPAAPKPASKTAAKESKPSKSSFKNLRSKIWVDDRYKDWEAGEVSELVDMLDGTEPDAAFWYQLFDTPEFTATLESDDRQAQWELVRGYLESQNYPDSNIDSLRSILEMEKILPKGEYPDEYLMSMPNSDNMSDDEFATVVSGYIKKMSNSKFGQVDIDAVVGYGANADD